jgi:hypothetical protein
LKGSFNIPPWRGSNRLSNQAAGESKPEAYPQGYVEDFDEPRTPLEAGFSISPVSVAALAAERGPDKPAKQRMRVMRP